MTNTILTDLIVSAQAAALKAKAAPDALAQQIIKREEFAVAGFDRATSPPGKTRLTRNWQCW
jgi:hypothetical protein